MRDVDIRRQLRLDLDELYRDDPHTIVVDELSLIEGGARVDVAVVNGALHAFEIKSVADSLARLPGQVEAYSAAFDSVTIIAAERHLAKIAGLVPGWWGVTMPVVTGHALVLQTVRAASKNVGRDPYAVVQFLWRDEALAALESRGLERGLRSKPRRVLWRALADQVPIDELAQIVRDQLRARPDWRAAAPPESGDASSRPKATSPDYRV